MKRQRWILWFLAILILFGLPAAAEEDDAAEEADAAEIQFDVPIESVTHFEGDTLVVDEGVTVIGMTEELIYDPATDDYRTEPYELLPGDVQLYTLYVDEDGLTGAPAVQLPASLRILGPEAITASAISRLRLPGTIREISPEAFYSVGVGEMILAADYTGPIPEGTYLSVGAYRVEEGNPLYSARDGILFSADGKALLRYPQGKTESFYEVPAGTETIGENAFSDSWMACDLLSVSLPIGLKRIEARPFSGCGLLRNVTVPLTVTELDPTAFANCVSLERLSLPPGFTATIGDAVEETDFTFYNGDNGSTMAAPRKEPSSWDTNPDFSSFRVMLDNAEGTGSVPLYADDRSDRIVEEKPVRTTVWIRDIRNGRADVTDNGRVRWIDRKNIRYIMDDYFFIAEDGEMLKPEQYNPDNRPYEFHYCVRDSALFRDPETDKDILVPLADVRLYREDKGDGAVYGFTVLRDPPVQLLDSPGGTPVGHLFGKDQARVIGRQDGWLQVETPYGDGWIPEDALIIVEPMKAK